MRLSSGAFFLLFLMACGGSTTEPTPAAPATDPPATAATSPAIEAPVPAAEPPAACFEARLEGVPARVVVVDAATAGDPAASARGGKVTPGRYLLEDVTYYTEGRAFPTPERDLRGLWVFETDDRGVAVQVHAVDGNANGVTSSRSFRWRPQADAPGAVALYQVCPDGSGSPKGLAFDAYADAVSGASRVDVYDRIEVPNGPPMRIRSRYVRVP